jgi:hypothetical protein
MRMMDWQIGRIALIFGCALAWPTWAVTNVTFQAPGAVSTFVNAINSNGDVAGGYVDTNQLSHIFLRTSDGIFTSFDVPGAIAVGASSINDQDTITGIFQSTSGNYFGFMISGGAVSIISPPGAVNTYTAVINDSGTIAGSYETTEGAFGYILSSDGTFTSFTPPGGILLPVIGTIAINNNGDVAGTTANGQAFVRYSSGTFSTKAGDTVPNTPIVHGLNSSDQVVGTDGFVVSRPPYGPYTLYTPFIWETSDNRVTRFPLNPYQSPNAYGINDSGEVVGTIENGEPYQNAEPYQGFLRAGDGRITIFSVGSFSTYPTGINNSGVICGSTIISESNLNYVGFLQFP